MATADGNERQGLWPSQLVRTAQQWSDWPNEWLWYLGVALFVAGDIVTTSIGLELGLVETQPVARAALASMGTAGLVALKLWAVVALVALYALVSRYRPRWAVGIPLGLVATGTALTAYNSLLIAATL